LTNSILAIGSMLFAILPYADQLRHEPNASLIFV